MSRVYFSRRPAQPSAQAGLSLVELMISVVLGFILILGVTEIYVNSKGTYRMTEEMSRAQENARIAFEMLVPQVRMAGYTGCANLNTAPFTSIADITPTELAELLSTTANAVGGNEAVSSSSWTPALDTTLAGLLKPPLANTDVLTIQSSGGCDGGIVKKVPGAPEEKINITNTCGIAADDLVMISDCQSVGLFKVTSITTGKGGGVSWQNLVHSKGKNGNTANGFSPQYGLDAEVFKPISTSYYIATGAGAAPALWRLDNTATTPAPLELVEGVENMQVTYGLDTDATPDGVVDRYVTADAIPLAGHDWDRVIIARISLLVRSIEPVRTDNQSYTFAGITTNDRYLRQEYTTTVQLRNRGLRP